LLCADAYKDDSGSLRIIIKFIIINYHKKIALIVKRFSVRSYSITLLGFMKYKSLTSSFFWAFLFSHWWKVFLSCFMLKWVSQYYYLYIKVVSLYVLFNLLLQDSWVLRSGKWHLFNQFFSLRNNNCFSVWRSARQ